MTDPVMDAAEQRLNALVDEMPYQNEPLYHAQIATYRRWLQMTAMALRDEHLSEDTVERVLNRLVYGTPDSEGAYERMASRRRMEHEVLNAFRSQPVSAFLRR